MNLVKYTKSLKSDVDKDIRRTPEQIGKLYGALLRKFPRQLPATLRLIWTRFLLFQDACRYMAIRNDWIVRRKWQQWRLATMGFAVSNQRSN